MTDRQRTEYLRIYMRKKRKERKELGLCTACGSRPAAQNFTKCEKCRERNSQRAKIRWQEGRKK